MATGKDRVGIVSLTALATALLSLFVYRRYFHPLAKFRGPWYASASSLALTFISLARKEEQFFMYLVRKYGTDGPIRISPTMLLFPRPSALRDIYWDPKLNNRSLFYGSGALGPPSLFTTLEANRHRELRKALSNAPWVIGRLKTSWESRFDDLVRLFVEKMSEHAAADRILLLSDTLPEFASDIMSMISFGEPFGCIKNQRDEKDILHQWRFGMNFFGFASRFHFFREHVLKNPYIGKYFLPSVSQTSGMGWLMGEADRSVTAREKANAERPFDGHPDFMQHCLEARYSDGTPLTAVEKRAHVTLLIQAGADTTGTALGSILRFMLLDPRVFTRARAEIDAADKAGKLSDPIQYEETRAYLPYFVACIKEGLRLNPPATNLFARVVPKSGRVIDGTFVPEGVDVTSHAYVVHRDKELYGDDAEDFRPERWLEDERRAAEFDAASFTFSIGPRVCIGKDIAIMELYKLLPELVRRFDVEMIKPGKYVVVGGVAYNVGFYGRLRPRTIAQG
ncbi:cytochrome P450 [Sporormia fimetaria CBS 119925]|uniref:Cytochrome P450 n=1 Tax=Sporormia fimetaria CBS 119925 TaxID=1340428 RepID=A0A6A6V2F1_9PLEO|nr:cytochrome P450 [Sporormia fimetaria CBS 119925]